MREQVIGGFATQLREIWRDARETYSSTRARFDGAVRDAQRAAQGAESSNPFLFSDDNIVDMGRSPPFLKRAVQTIGSLFATGLLVGGLAALALALLQLLGAFFVLTQFLGIRVDLPGAPS